MVDTVLPPTLVSTVGVSLVTVVSTVIVAVAGPVFWDAATAVTLELDAGAGMAAACFVTVISTVVVCAHAVTQDFIVSCWVVFKYSCTKSKSR